MVALPSRTTVGRVDAGLVQAAADAWTAQQTATRLRGAPSLEIRPGGIQGTVLFHASALLKVALIEVFETCSRPSP